MKNIVIVFIAALFLQACSLKKMAVNQIGNALAGGGGVYLTDDDPDLIRESLPFGLKTFESLLEISPKNEGLILATASGYTSYAFLLSQEADRIDNTYYYEAQRLRMRASKLFLRGRNFALKGLAINHSNIAQNILHNRAKALAEMKSLDAPLLYWTAVSWAGAISMRLDDPSLIAALPIAGDIMERILELDETYDSGAAHEFLITYEASRPGGSVSVARDHYSRALELSKGNRASVYLALAESISVPEQNLSEFLYQINAVKSVDVNAVPELRLVNTLAQERARRLENGIPDLFLEYNGEQ